MTFYRLLVSYLLLGYGIGIIQNLQAHPDCDTEYCGVAVINFLDEGKNKALYAAMKDVAQKAGVKAFDLTTGKLNQRFNVLYSKLHITIAHLHVRNDEFERLIKAKLKSELAELNYEFEQDLRGGPIDLKFDELDLSGRFLVAEFQDDRRDYFRTFHRRIIQKIESIMSDYPYQERDYTREGIRKWKVYFDKNDPKIPILEVSTDFKIHISFVKEGEFSTRKGKQEIRIENKDYIKKNPKPPLPDAMISNEFTLEESSYREGISTLGLIGKKVFPIKPEKERLPEVMEISEVPEHPLSWYRKQEVMELPMPDYKTQAINLLAQAKDLIRKTDLNIEDKTKSVDSILDIIDILQQ